MNIEQFDYSVDLLNVVLWQYNEASSLLSLLNQKQTWYNTNQTQFWQNWYTQVFNLSATNTNFTLFGAAVWSIILDVPLYVPLTPITPGNEWGFNAFNPTFPTYENSYLNFNNAPFAPSQRIISLTLDQQIFLLLLKYFNCTNRGTLSYPNPNNVFVNNTQNQVYFNNFTYSINYYLKYLCDNMADRINYTGGTIYCEDNLNMTIHYVSTGTFPSNLQQAIQMLDLLPRPAGVLIV